MGRIGRLVVLLFLVGIAWPRSAQAQYTDNPNSYVTVSDFVESFSGYEADLCDADEQSRTARAGGGTPEEQAKDARCNGIITVGAAIAERLPYPPVAIPGRAIYSWCLAAEIENQLKNLIMFAQRQYELVQAPGGCAAERQLLGLDGPCYMAGDGTQYIDLDVYFYSNYGIPSYSAIVGDLMLNEFYNLR